MTEYLCDRDTFEHKGRTFRVRYEPDQDTSAPWKEYDGHGPVSGWTTRAKAPSEWLLFTDRDGSKRYYDFAEAVKIARRDQWGTTDGRQEGETAGEYAVRAVIKDFQYLRGWCHDDWSYVGVIVTELDADGDDGESESLWSVETLNDYPSTVARELADALIARGPAPTTAAEMEAQHERDRECAAELAAALRGLFEHCAMIHKYWGDGNNQKQADAAVSTARALLARIDAGQIEAGEIVLEGLTPAEQFSIDPEGMPGS